MNSFGANRQNHIEKRRERDTAHKSTVEEIIYCLCKFNVRTNFRWPKSAERKQNTTKSSLSPSSSRYVSDFDFDLCHGILYHLPLKCSFNSGILANKRNHNLWNDTLIPSLIYYIPHCLCECARHWVILYARACVCLCAQERKLWNAKSRGIQTKCNL